MPGFSIPGDLALNATATDAATDGTALERVRQRIRNNFEIVLGSYTYDVNAGFRVSWLSTSLGARLGLQREEIRRIIAETRGVQTVQKLSLRFDPSARTLFGDFEAQTIYGFLVDELGIEVQ